MQTPTPTHTSTDPPPTKTPEALEPTDRKLSLGLETVVEGLQIPTAVAIPPDDPDRRYIAEQPGTIKIHDADGLRGEPFLDIRDAIVTSYEQGLLGFALHPEFSDNRRVFVRYSAPPRKNTPSKYSHTFVLTEFEATTDGLRAKPASERPLLEIPEPQKTHNAGDLVFGPNGYLYVGVGDGGGGNDQGPGHVGDWYEAVPGGNGQDVTENLLGSVLRIDVDQRESPSTETKTRTTITRNGNKPYGVPQTNPLVGREGLDEHYAWGFRNPWRMSFNDGRLFVGDVGQQGYEEVSIVRRGGNYGWNVKEGRHCFQTSSCPDRTPDGQPLLDPRIEYPNWKHSDAVVSGAAVICGYLYSGSALADLRGKFVFGDWAARGRLFVANPAEKGQWPVEVIKVPPDDRGKLYTLTSFERGPAGELYILTTRKDGTGGVHRLVSDG